MGLKEKCKPWKDMASCTPDIVKTAALPTPQCNTVAVFSKYSFKTNVTSPYPIFKKKKKKTTQKWM